jgi:hypothetical protein
MEVAAADTDVGHLEEDVVVADRRPLHRSEFHASAGGGEVHDSG